MMDCCLRVGHLYPDHMNLYGDRGNVMAFVYRAGLRGIRVSVEPLQPGDRIEPGRYDFFFFGGGQDAEQERIHRAGWIKLDVKKAIRYATELRRLAANVRVLFSPSSVFYN